MIISFGTLIWTIYRDWLDKGRVRINAYMGREMDANGKNKSPLGVHLMFQNIGRQPVYLKGWYIKTKDDKGKIGGLFLPGQKTPRQKIEPGSAFDEFVPTIELLQKPGVQGLFLEDKLGRKWWLKKKTMKRL